MMRILLIFLAIVIAVLAFVLDQIWLYWAAGALLVAAVVVVVVRMWRRYQEAVRFQREEGQSAPRHPELSELGIMEVRPRDEAASGPEEPPPEAATAPAESTPSASAEDAASPSGRAPTRTTQEPEPASATEPADDGSDAPAPEAEDAPAASGEQSESDPVLQPYLQALRAATESHAACLLVQEDVTLSYRIEAAASRAAALRRTGTFETTDPLLSANMTQVEVTVQPVGRDGVDPAQLGYYETTPPLAQVAMAPVPTPSAASTYFLVLDATDTHLNHPRAKKLITHFADLLGLLIESETSPRPSPAPDRALDAEDAKPRPRREIIAEEIQDAQRRSSPLALALVHLNQSERLAQEGTAVVADAESALRTRLERSAPRSRVERFGELTYGVFYNGDVTDVEPWAERLQEEMDGVGGLLTGGVSIGVAMLREDAQSPKQLRENATEALRMAYETGTCTIVE
ncbi:MAG: hypothetical protein GVY35_15060 [Bacteroidetes bacterium]|jgi:GGDEF domain-containing protein|nr:hypothetical protein [Bacteroidota bacterium]